MHTFSLILTNCKISLRKVPAFYHLLHVMDGARIERNKNIFCFMKKFKTLKKKESYHMEF